MKKEVSGTGIVGISPTGLLDIDGVLILYDAVKKIAEQLEIEGYHRFAGRVTITIEDLTKEVEVHDLI